MVCMKNGEERTGHSAGSREWQAHRAEWERAEKEGRQESGRDNGKRMSAKCAVKRERKLWEER